jgi:hypothetical protein
VHLAFTYDGSGKAAGVKLYIDGQPQEVEVVTDTLEGSIRTSAPFQVARRTGGEASPETSVQDLKLYARALSPEEMRSLPHEDLAREIAQKPMAKWTVDERTIVTDYFFGSLDREAMALRGEIARLETEFQRATAGGVATPIAKERDSRAVGLRAEPRHVRRDQGARRSRRPRGATVVSLRSATQPARVRTLAFRPGTPAHRTRRREPDVAGTLRCRHRRKRRRTSAPSAHGRRTARSSTGLPWNSRKAAGT